MSKLNINKSSFDFFKNNKIKSLAMIGVIITSLSMCSPYVNKDDIKKREMLKSLKNNIENNYDNIQVIKDYENKYYAIAESVYKETPYYKINDDNAYVNHIEETKAEIIHYCISFEDAENLNLTELLEEKTNSKIKRIDN